MTYFPEVKDISSSSVKTITSPLPQVKNMISTRRDSVRKKSSSAQHRKSTVERPSHDLHAGVAVEVSAASDPEVRPTSSYLVSPVCRSRRLNTTSLPGSWWNSNRRVKCECMPRIP